MKLKNIFSLLLLSVVALFTSCSNDDDITLLDDIQVFKIIHIHPRGRW